MDTSDSSCSFFPERTVTGLRGNLTTATGLTKSDGVCNEAQKLGQCPTAFPGVRESLIETL